MNDPKVRLLEEYLNPWYTSVNNAPVIQHQVMTELLRIYEDTELGQRSHAESIENYDMFKGYFPVSTYDTLSAYFNSVYSGEYAIMMAEPPLVWALSRDRHKGASRHFPVTPMDLRDRVSAWPRALFTYIYKTGRLDLLGSGLINLSFPASVGVLQFGQAQLPTGYASGIVSRYASERFGLSVMPPQNELDGLPGDLGRKSWLKRFKLIVKHARGKDVGAIKGEVNAILDFGKYIKRQYNMAPKQIWGVSVIVCFNGGGIHTKYKIPLRELFGDCAVLESYEIAEGALFQQMDESPYLVPNYDLYFYEVEVQNQIKPLYSMQPGEAGSIIISSAVLPRFKIGDIVQCMAPNKFVIIGRDKALSKIKYNVFASGSPLTTQRDIW